MPRDIYQQSLAYHRRRPYGKLAIVPIKPLADRHDLALAYSPGVAEPCRAIFKDPSQAAELTARSNLIAVITNGTAVLGLGNIGPLASKPVMEGKAILFKKFADIDAFDIEINEADPDKLVDIIAALEPTFGGINLEDIKAPECFYIEKKLKERLKIPVFHDDQHGTAITVGAAILNGLELLDKKIDQVRLVTSGAGAAALACLDLLLDLGLKRENVTITDSKGVVFEGREGIEDDSKGLYAQDTHHRHLSDAIEGADIFLGLSVANVLTPEMVATMAPRPLILALANPDPEILPPLVAQVRNDAIVATGRSDYPNQVNNAVCFPYIFRGALDVGATTINQEMKIACVKAIAKLAQAESSDIVSNAYNGEIHSFGPDFIVPKPFDPRLFVELAFVVAQAAMDTGVATRPIKDMVAYREHLQAFIYGSSQVMQPVFATAKQQGHRTTRIVFAEGEEERVLQAVQTLCDEKIGLPILVGRPDIIQRRINALSLRLKAGEDYQVVDPNNDPRYHHYWTTYHRLTERRGVSADVAKTLVRTNTTIIAALMVHLGDADTLICGIIGRYIDHFRQLQQILDVQPQFSHCAALCALVMDHQPLFICDPYINIDPTAEQLVEMTLLSAQQIRRFGITPKVALISHSNFGSSRSTSARKMQTVLQMLRQVAPELEVEGEMHADAALCPDIRQKIFPNSQLQGPANLLVMPNIEAANISFKMARALGNELIIGPILMGIRGSAQILTPTINVRGIVDMTALALVDALECSKT
ncbi:NADP-dependent malic enzyme [Candidatus Finniella inopinata]|uniref:NADP-dependent malic enzyme n=1 Tax=Candidatus Finniella inopinata TaxID=1696036 RepID=A0A4Q7DJH3_9PROT|nr:NADP-dependent malic enzyme [Candidatus Finniella inopinata]RZI46184.1 NADP-dependent malic enzyme [Candidatus Finniella inopinata]